MAAITWVEFVLHILILLLSFIAFIIFLVYINNFVPGEAKRIFALLTIFLGVYFLSHLSADIREIAEFLSKGQFSEELAGTTTIIEHILQAISLSFLFYIAVLFRGFAKKLEKARKA